LSQHTVIVWDKPCEVSVYQKSKTVWWAVGDYMGKTIRVKGRTASDAATQWRRAATYAGNG